MSPWRLSAIRLRWAERPHVLSSPGVTRTRHPEPADRQPVSEGRARGRKAALASPVTLGPSCQLAFLVGVRFKVLPLKCGLGHNILEELLAQTRVFLCETANHGGKYVTKKHQRKI